MTDFSKVNGYGVGGTAASVAAIFDAYKGTSSAQAIANTATDVTWITEREKDTGFTHSASSAEVQFDFDGRVEITVDLTADSSDASTRQQCEWWLMLDTGSGYSEVAGTRAASYHRVSGTSDQTATISIVLDVSNGDKIKVQGQASAASVINTTDNGCRITCQKVSQDAAQTPIAGVPSTADVIYADSQASTSALTWRTLFDITSVTNDGGILYWLYNDGAVGNSWRWRVTIDGTAYVHDSTALPAYSVADGQQAIGPLAVGPCIMPLFFTASCKLEIYNPSVSAKTLYWRYAYQYFDYS